MKYKHTCAVTLPNGKSYELMAKKAIVLSSSRDNETHVWGGGGGGSVVNGHGSFSNIVINSKVVSHYRVWVRYLHDNVEQELDLGERYTECRTDNEVYVVGACTPTTGESFDIIAVRNETTLQGKYIAEPVDVLQTLGLIVAPKNNFGVFKFIATWALAFVAYTVMGNILGRKAMESALGLLGSLAVIFPVVPFALGYLSNVKASAARAQWLRFVAEPVQTKFSSDVEELLTIARTADSKQQNTLSPAASTAH